MALIGQTKVAEGKFVQSTTMADKHGQQSRQGADQAVLRENEENQRALAASIARRQDEQLAEVAMQQIRFAEAHFEEQKVLVLLQGFRACAAIYHKFAFIGTICLGMASNLYVTLPVGRTEQGHRWAFWIMCLLAVMVLIYVVFVSKVTVIFGTELAFQGTMGLHDVRRAFHGLLDNRGSTFWWLLLGFGIFNILLLHTIWLQLHRGSDLTTVRVVDDGTYAYGGVILFVWILSAVRSFRSFRAVRKDFAFVDESTGARYGEQREVTERDLLPASKRRKSVTDLVLQDAWNGAYTNCATLEISLRKQPGADLPLRLYEHSTKLPVVELLSVKSPESAKECTGVVGWHLLEVDGAALVDLPRPLVPSIMQICAPAEMVTLRFAEPPERAMGALEQWSDRVCGSAYLMCVAGAVLLQFDADGDRLLNQKEFYGFYSLVQAAVRPGGDFPSQEKSDERYTKLSSRLAFNPRNGMQQRHVAHVLRRAPPQQLELIAQKLGLPPQRDMLSQTASDSRRGSRGRPNAPFGEDDDAPRPAASSRFRFPSADPSEVGLTARGVGGMDARRFSASVADHSEEPMSFAPAPTAVTQSVAGRSDGDFGSEASGPSFDGDGHGAGYAIVHPDVLHMAAASGVRMY